MQQLITVYIEGIIHCLSVRYPIKFSIPSLNLFLHLKKMFTKTLFEYISALIDSRIFSVVSSSILENLRYIC
uniref:Ovule protein n=1 Tax=Parascaris univalens TaxID=6257 RepID=A0A915AJ16_PARUN